MRPWLVLTALSLSSGPVLAGEAPVDICLGDSYEWPPFTYWARDANGQPDRTRLVGSAASRVLDALKALGLGYRLHYLPWPRIQRELADYADNRRCELTWDASYQADRARFALYSTPLYSTHLVLFYSARRFLEPPRLRLPDDLRGYRLCGSIGYNYQPFRIDWPFEQLPTLQQALNMLARDRCDFFPSDLEPLQGGLALGTYRADDKLKYLPLEARSTFYLLVSKGSPRARELLAGLDAQFALQAAGSEAHR